MANDDLTDFGNVNVKKSEKTLLVKNIFEEVSEKYDLMNDLMSLGIHRIRKSSFLDWMAPRPNHHLLDLAGGTGDIGINFIDSCLLYTSPSPRDRQKSRMPSSA